jgi:ATPase family associated with various cellular activities (AAA)
MDVEMYNKALSDWLASKREYIYGMDAKQKWLQDHEQQEQHGHSLSVPDFLLLEKNVSDSHQRMIDAHQRLQDAFRMMNTHQLLIGDHQRMRDASPRLMSSNEPQNKKSRIAIPEVAYQGPVPLNFFHVPMETIDIHQRLQALLSSTSENRPRPLSILYGPRQFGKTTIAHRLAEEIMRCGTIHVIFLHVSKPHVCTEKSFWNVLGQLLDAKKRDVSSEKEFVKAIPPNSKVCLFLDNMDTLLENKSLTKSFIDTLLGWQTAPFFHGFLGIGSYELVDLQRQYRGDHRISPFNFMKVKPFTIEQMISFFATIRPSYPFDASMLAIVDYSSGVPGVFGSLIRFTIDFQKFDFEAQAWHRWFNSPHITAMYLKMCNTSYKRIQEDLQRLNDSDWEALTFVILHRYKPSNSRPNELKFERLVDMGLIKKDAKGELCFSSMVMEKICLEAQSVQKMSQDDPFDLLALSISWMQPDIIRHLVATNQKSSDVSALHFELYAAMRGVLKKYITRWKVLAEVQVLGNKERLDIIISNGTRYGLELKSNILHSKEIEAAVKEAEAYRKHLGTAKMFLVNVVPQGYHMDEVYELQDFSDIKIIHVVFQNTFHACILKFLGENGKVETHTVHSIDI